MTSNYTYTCEECSSKSVSFNERLGEMTCDECGLVIITELFEETVLPVDKKGDIVHSPDRGKLGSVINGKLGKVAKHHHAKSNYSSYIMRGLSFCKILLANFTSYEDRACAIVYYCLLENNTPVKYADVCSIEFQSDKSKVIKLVKKIKKTFGKVTKPIDYRYEIERVAVQVLNNVGFVQQCLDIHDYFQPIINESNYNIPTSYPVAIAWIATNVNCRTDVTASMISRNCNISRWSIRNTTNRLLELIGKKEVKEIRGKELK